MDDFKRLLRRTVLITSFTSPLLGLLSGCSSDNNSNYTSPNVDTSRSEFIAKATVIGSYFDGQYYHIRSGTDAIITAKDSDSDASPVVSFRWEVLSVEGDSSIEDINNALIERTTNAKLFSAPDVSEDTIVNFRLHIATSDGRETSSNFSVLIEAVNDAGEFLQQFTVNSDSSKFYEIQVQLNSQQGEIPPPEFDYDIEITTTANWIPRSSHSDCNVGPSGNECTMNLGVQRISDQISLNDFIDSELNADNFFRDYFYSTYRIPYPKINLDDINKHFENPIDRNKRLEIDQADHVTLYHTFSLSSNSDTSLTITGNDGSASELLTLNQGDAPQTLNIEDIKQLRLEGGISSENIQTAQAYYHLIDPDGTANTLESWLSQTAFNQSSSESPNQAHAIYVNNYDLGFGRDMRMTSDECGNVYSYVNNYPSLENTIETRGRFATVAMEYSPLIKNEDGSCSDAPKFVKFFAFIPNEAAGTNDRVDTINFDGRGELPIPGACTVCHGGSTEDLVSEFSDSARTLPMIEHINQLREQNNQDKLLELADLNATFMPFDLNSFLYTQARNPTFVDPAYNPLNVRPASTQQYSRENQLSQFIQLNKFVLWTYLHKQASLPEEEQQRWQAPIDLINTWYNTSIFDVESLDDIDNQNYSDQRILPGWSTHAHLYDEVFSRYCRACHIQIEDTDINFDNSTEFLEDNEQAIINKVFEERSMPLARLTYDRFWSNFYGRDSAASLLANEFNHDEFVLNKPPIAEATQFIVSTNPDSDSDLSGPQAGDLVRLESEDFSDLTNQFLWRINTTCTTPTIFGSNSPSAHFIPLESPCEYEVFLDASNQLGVSSTSDPMLVSFDNKAFARRLELLFNQDQSLSFNSICSDEDILFDYIPGTNMLSFDLDDYIERRGDNTCDTNMTFTPQTGETETGSGYALNENGVLTANLSTDDVLSGTSFSFEYGVADADDTLDNIPVENMATLSVTTPNISPSSITTSTSINPGAESSNITLNWGLNFQNISEDLRRNGLFEIYRFSCESNRDQDGQLINANSPIQILNANSLSYTDNNLPQDECFRYEIDLVYQGSRSTSSTIEVVTDAVPSLNDISRITANSIEVSWSFPGGGNFSLEGYNIKYQIEGAPSDVFECQANDSRAAGEPIQDTITNLTPNTIYNIHVEAVSEGDSLCSEEDRRSRVIKVITNLAQINDFRVRSRGQSFVHLNISTPNNLYADRTDIINSFRIDKCTNGRVSSGCSEVSNSDYELRNDNQGLFIEVQDSTTEAINIKSSDQITYRIRQSRVLRSTNTIVQGSGRTTSFRFLTTTASLPPYRRPLDIDVTRFTEMEGCKDSSCHQRPNEPLSNLRTRSNCIIDLSPNSLTDNHITDCPPSMTGSSIARKFGCNTDSQNGPIGTNCNVVIPFLRDWYQQQCQDTSSCPN